MPDADHGGLSLLGGLIMKAKEEEGANKEEEEAMQSLTRCCSRWLRTADGTGLAVRCSHTRYPRSGAPAHVSNLGLGRWTGSLPPGQWASTTHK